MYVYPLYKACSSIENGKMKKVCVVVGFCHMIGLSIKKGQYPAKDTMTGR